jgi:regulatory protein
MVDLDATERARQLCLTELDRAPRTRRQLADLLTKQEVPGDVAEAVLDRFVEVGLLDDAAFAEQWVRDRHGRRGVARGQLRQELARQGISTEDAESAVGAIDADDERAAALALIARKVAATRGLDHQVRARRLAGALARKGYAAELVFDVVREALAADGADVD